MAARRILYQLVAPLSATVGPHEPRRRRDFLAAHAAPGVEVVVRDADGVRDGIQGDWDALVAGPVIVRGLRAAEAEGFDAVIVGCFSDPALDAAREAVSIPVVGPGASSIALALQCADRFSVLSPGEGGAARTRATLRAMGLADRLASVRGVGLTVPEMARAASQGGLDAALDRIAAVASACVEQDGAEALIFGCMSMAFLDPTPRITARVAVPVVNPVLAALRMAETLASLGLTHSRRRWPETPDRPLVRLDPGEADNVRQLEASR
ncbi:aspartate/glutamate racemase family protein [Rubrimonas sp.]|uniref:aspartate/glutamate racemase family protein n=1 Tax=Rubrimonas sp. TaxID=2036015 RepID=UPI002FDCC770